MEVLAQRVNKVVYREGDYAIKEFSEDYSKADVLNEALNQARVEETGLPIPKLIEVKKIDNKWAIVLEYVEGKTIAQLIEEHPEKENEYLEKFVEVQLSIHEKRAPLLNKLKDKMNRKISATELDATTRYDLHTRLEGMPKHTKVCHGDLGLSDVIINEAGDAYIIDWAHATQGNAAADAARSYLKLCLEGKGEMASKYLKIYCKKSDTAKQYVQKWMPIVAASQTVKGKPEERELLMSWVSVVDYE
ncbi:MAG: aminoglycoside phosphotransferase [Ruminococcus sp.]|nr:aminoglycoside phosphotransferase [Ruminococcus sp.]MBQ7002886.1 phosphotransferase [Oscillospiraceae bacterium]